MRINRYLATAGLGSRRACEELVLEGRVSINGKTVTDLASQVAPGDQVKVGNRKLTTPSLTTLALNKPRGILTTCSDPERRTTVLDILPEGMGRLFPVGRLDKESEGLLLLTNNGDLAQRLTHPSHQVEKEYEVILDHAYESALTPKLLRGFLIEGGRAKMEAVHPLGARRIKVILRQGIKRQIRLMFFEVGYEVVRLKRIRIGKLKLGRLLPGEWRQLSRSETLQLEQSGGDTRRREKITSRR